ncbi:MAG TPA: hypothetical protein VGL48_10155 [Acidimicrobiales bacterium]
MLGVLVGLWTIALAPCSLSGASVAASSVKQYKAAEISFRYPSSWKISRFQEESSFSTAMVFLSNEKLHPPCRTSQVPAGQEITCGNPLQHLSKRGVLLEWAEVGTPTFSIDQTPGITGKIGGLVGRLEVTHPGTCSDVGADETITAVADRAPPADNNRYVLTACLRGPNLKSSTAMVAALIRSTSFPGDTGS